MAKKYVYLFKEGNANMRELLGGKGANLAEMTNLGLPVPRGFTITTEACTKYYDDGRKISDDILAEISEYVTKLEEQTGKKFGDTKNPLLVSVRSGARASMPGMMDTILNLGLNEEVVDAIIEKTGNERWARDSRTSTRRKRARTSPPTRRSSSSAPSRPCSHPGTTRVPMFTAATMISRIPGVPQSTFRKWYSVTGPTTPVPALLSPVTRPPVRTHSMLRFS